MTRILVALALTVLCAFPAWTQETTEDNRKVQFHGFFSQGIVRTDGNNWLTMQNGDQWSTDFTEFGGNLWKEFTDKLRVGAQIYDRKLGELGQWHPQLDWAVVSYKFRPWLGLRVGKVKTVLGLYNDTQDFDFLHTPVLLPQSVYPTDVRDTTIAHVGGDLYGDVTLGDNGGTLSYTVYSGRRNDSEDGGYAYLLGDLPQTTKKAFNYMRGGQMGWDVRWAAPVAGLLIGVSRIDEDISARFGEGTPIKTTLSTTFNWTNQFYVQYRWNNLQIDSEYREVKRNVVVDGPTACRCLNPEFLTHVQGWYVGASYQFAQKFHVGSYYSNYEIDIPPNLAVPPGQGHDYSKVVTFRYDVNRHVNVKVEGHFMDGYGLARIYPNGFYRKDNPQGLKDNTNALIIKTSVAF
jgi:hypothetical protein